MSAETARAPRQAGSSCHHEFFSTGGFQPAERFAIWRDLYLKRCEPFPVVGAAGETFTASSRYLVVPEGEFTDLRTTSTGLTRPPRLCRADEIDNVALAMTLSGGGAGWFSDPDLTGTFFSGYVRVRDQARPYVVQLTAAENRTLHLELPRASFDSRTLSRILAAAGRRLPTRGLVPMLAAQMKSFAEIAAGLDPAARAAGLRSILDLAATVLRLEYGTVPAESEVCEDGMLVAAQALIRRRFGETDLSPDAIAHRLGCSRAHLYRVFARHGLSVAGYLRETRLQRSHVALAAAEPRDTVGNIAFRCGFDNPVYFAHLFYQRFGMRPSEVLRRDRDSSEASRGGRPLADDRSRAGPPGGQGSRPAM